MTIKVRMPRVVSRRALLRAAGVAGASGLVLLPIPTTGNPSPSSGTGFVGRAIDLATLQPVAGALIQADPSGVQTTADQTGSYVLPLPPGTYTVRVSRDRFVGAIRLNQVVPAQGYLTLDLDLIPTDATPDQQEAIYRRLVKQVQSPPPVPESAVQHIARLTVSEIPSQIKVVFPDGSVQWVPLEDYVKGVVPNEVYPTWPAETLKAQAVAARTWGVARFLAVGSVCTTTACQVYDPQSRWPTTDAATDATAGEVMTANGSLISAFYFSRCNGVSTRNSWQYIGYSGTNGQGQQVCTVGSFGVTTYCVARPCTWNQASTYRDCGYNGHGVGMCQYGAAGQGQTGASYRDILNSYYTGISIVGGCAGSSATNGPSVASNQAGPFHVFLPIVANNACS